LLARTSWINNSICTSIYVKFKNNCSALIFDRLTAAMGQGWRNRGGMGAPPLPILEHQLTLYNQGRQIMPTPFPPDFQNFRHLALSIIRWTTKLNHYCWNCTANVNQRDSNLIWSGTTMRFLLNMYLCTFPNYQFEKKLKTLVKSK
jgi:hypothetical protein